MIRDLSETLQAVLTDPALAAPFPELSRAQVVFDRPDDTFKPSQTTIDLFLFDVRENLELRNNEPKVEATNGQAVIRKTPLRVDCTYLVTAWPVGGADAALQEQQLLSQVLQVLSTYPKIPALYLKGKLAGQDPQLPMMTTHPEELKNPAEFWTAIGNRMRASVTTTVTISMEVFAPVVAPIVNSALVRVGELVPGTQTLKRAGQLQSYRIRGRVTKGGQAVADALVAVTGFGLAARTDAEGNYVVGAIQPGAYTLKVQSNGSSKQISVTVPGSALTSYDIQL